MGAFPLIDRDSNARKSGQTGSSSGLPEGAYTFAKLFCRIHRCREEDIEERVLWHCLYNSATIPLAWVVLKFDPDFFRADLQMISDIKAATAYVQVREMLADHHTAFLKKSFLRNRLKLRVSRTKLISLARTVLRSEF